MQELVASMAKWAYEKEETFYNLLDG